MVLPITNVMERFVIGSTFFTEQGEKERRELLVEQVAEYKNGFLIKFQGYEDMSAAETLRNIKLLAKPLDIEDSEALFVHRLVGLNVVDQDGIQRGTVEYVQANPASDLLVLETGGMIPLVFVESVTDQDIFVRIPEGLLE